MSAKIETITDVAEKHLCAGCGACAYFSAGAIEMVDDLERGRRPIVRDPGRAADALAVCPGVGLEHSYDAADPALARSVERAWGPVVQVFEGYATDPELRYAGSSGGAASALAIHALERAGFHGLLHIAAREDVPYLNRTVLSRSREEVLAATGSRYAPASPCDGLGLIEEAPGPCVFIGKPCDVAATHKARELRAALDERLGLTISIFCAGAPSTRGTLTMLRAMGVEPATLETLRYRGNGWPGKATAVATTPEGEVTRELSYEESWGGILESHRPWRCNVCADHTGEFADVSVGDPWHRPVGAGDPGRSLVVARTRRGRELVQRAMRDGYLTLEEVAPENITASQPNLLRTRGAVWARIFTCRVFGVAAPRYERLPMFGTWWSVLSMRDKLRSVLGTLNRIRKKRLRRRRPVEPMRVD